MWVQSESQQRFRKLEAAIRQIEPGDRRGELAGQDVGIARLGLLDGTARLHRTGALASRSRG